MTAVLNGYDFETIDGPADSVPVTVDVEYPCDKCGRETGWSGTGRRRKYCDDCKVRPVRQATAKPATRVTGNASNLAAQGAKALVGINNLVGFGLLAVGLHSTSATILAVQNDFETQAYQALLADPKLAQSILSVGTVSGKMMLGMAYLTMGMGVAPVALAELKAKRAANEIEEEG